MGNMTADMKQTRQI